MLEKSWRRDPDELRLEPELRVNLAVEKAETIRGIRKKYFGSPFIAEVYRCRT